MRNGYHGLLGGAGNSTSVKNWVSGVTRVPGHEKLAWPSAYRSIYPNLELLKRDAIETIESNTTQHIAGMIFEPLQGVGGITEYVPGYHKMITDTIRSFGGLIISD